MIKNVKLKKISEEELVVNIINCYEDYLNNGYSKFMAINKTMINYKDFKKFLR